MSQRALRRRARTHLEVLRNSPRSSESEEGSLLLAILLAILVTSLIAAATITTIAGQKKTQTAQRYSAGQQSADAAVADLMRFANQGGDPGYYDGSTTAKTRKYTPASADAETTGWKWTAKSGTSGNPDANYDVTITTTPVGAAGPVRTFSVHIAALPVKDPNDGTGPAAEVKGGSISYNASTGANLSGFFADSEAVLRGSSKVDSYDSGTGTLGTGRGSIGSNGIVTFSSAANADRVTLWNFTASPNTDRCTGSRCSAGEVDTQPFRLGGTGSCAAVSPASSYPGPCTNNAPTRFIDQACAGKDIKPWIASENGSTPTLTGGTVMCVSSMLFDRNTVVNGSPANPVRIYVTGAGTGASPAASGSDGSITVLPGISVNVSGNTPVSTNLLIFAKSADVTLLSGGATNTRVAWALWAPNADCGGQDPSASARYVVIYGAMTCARISTGLTWYLRYDEQQRLLEDASPMKAWFMTTYDAN